MPLLINPTCACIRSANGTLLAQCARCRVREDPEFRRRCDTDFNEKPVLPKSARKKAHARKP